MDLGEDTKSFGKQNTEGRWSGGTSGGRGGLDNAAVC